MKILHYTGCWPTNIGNAFIDLGAREFYKQAFPECEVDFISSYREYLGSTLYDKKSFEYKYYVDYDFLALRVLVYTMNH